MKKLLYGSSAVLLAGAVALGAAALSHGPSAGSAPRVLTYGTIPRAAFGEAGVDLQKVPDLIAVADPTGGSEPVGYARKEDLYPEAFGNPDLGMREYRLIPVYDAAGTKLLGSVYPDYGFVSLDVSDDPSFDINSLIHTKTTTVENLEQP